jgi:hypothetical protein
VEPLEIHVATIHHVERVSVTLRIFLPLRKSLFSD